MLVGVMFAYSKCQSQIDESEKVTQATKLADQLLYSWTVDGNVRPTGETGAFDSQWSWRLLPISDLQNIRVVELQVFFDSTRYQNVQLLLPR